MGNLCIQDGQKVLFIGDSITDCGRRDVFAPLGNGYVKFFTELVMAKYPERNIEYVNTGIGGNRVTDLKARWQVDAMDHNPDWLSIKIGINDLHSFLGGDPNGVSPELFEEMYEYLLDLTTKSLDCKIILIDPFYISTDFSSNSFQSKVLDIIPKYIDVVHKMSEKYDTKLVKLHDMFQNQLKYRDASTFCPEPVHPNLVGHLIMAMEVLKVLSK
ncbi:TPA: GDSL family lipase [bacterium]|nr:GDSL family lipase [bacterium]